ncbi:M15 family metallopeptidase [Rubrimonas cliftonensis]|uniref:D-alanyl-D-alanine carboxypeptidase n=1 Tax=Rubrimonas cliftonensis TaxID=89524 RepID=A0A1H3WQK5_9RHOB|nr:M15 family metallopeptidase [Rubrimonas cliftonensis]SDZ89413.1 D-alanyl-D-alanine carboxypeptidase [Rubrimonas cliftonensis]
MTERRGGALRLVGPLAIAFAILAAPVIWRLTAPQEQAALTAQRAAVLEAQIANLADRLDLMRDRMEALEAAQKQAALAPLPDIPATPAPAAQGFGGYADLMRLSARRSYNTGLKLLSTATLREVFGDPADALGQECSRPTSPRLLALLETRDVGPFRAQLIRPALDSLEAILARVEDDDPDLYAQLKSYGGLCARLVRGSQEAISRHAFGLAIDISIGGTLDAMGDGQTQLGLILMSDFFLEEGWIWGAAFSREDSMHFEVSQELFERWRVAGLLDVELPEGAAPPDLPDLPEDAPPPAE